MTSVEKLIAHATPRAKKFRNDIEALKEVDDGDQFVRELQRDSRKVMSSHVDLCCALYFNFQERAENPAK